MRRFLEMAKNSADPSYIRLSRLANESDLSEEEVLDYGINGKLKIRALSRGWELQVGYYLDDGPHKRYEPSRRRCDTKP